MRVLIAHNGRDYDVDLVWSTLREAGHTVSLVPVDSSLPSTLTSTKPDIVFNLAEGFAGTHRRVFAPSCFDVSGVPFTGSDALTSAICHDKMSCKELLSLLKIPTPRAVLVDSLGALRSKQSLITFPCFVKPNNGTDGTGVAERSLCRNASDALLAVAELLEDGRGPVLVEDAITGREVSVVILGSWPDLTVLPPVQLDLSHLDGLEVYGEEARAALDGNPFTAAQLHPKVNNALLDFAQNAYAHLGCRDWGRVDFIVGTDQTPYLINIETIPSMAEMERVSAAAKLDGVSVPELVEFVLNTAITRSQVQQSADEDEVDGQE